MRKNKKIAIFLISCLMGLSLTACSSNQRSTNVSEDTEDTSDLPLTSDNVEKEDPESNEYEEIIDNNTSGSDNEEDIINIESETEPLDQDDDIDTINFEDFAGEWIIDLTKSDDLSVEYGINYATYGSNLTIDDKGLFSICIGIGLFEEGTGKIIDEYLNIPLYNSDAKIKIEYINDEKYLVVQLERFAGGYAYTYWTIE